MRKGYKKKQSRKNLIIVCSIIFIGIISLTIVYAALSTTLSITGNGSVNAADFGIEIKKFVDYSPDYICQNYVCGEYFAYTSGVEIKKEPIIEGTKLKDFDVAVNKPGDVAIFLYVVRNFGSIPLKLESINYKTPTITSSINNNTDVEWARNNFDFEYSLDIYDPSLGDRNMVVGDVICPDKSTLLTMGVGILGDATTIPLASVFLSNLGVELNFVQADESACFEE